VKKRNPVAVLLLPIITLGIYGIVWYVRTKNEMNSLGAQIPTAWLIIIPFVNIWWLWQWCKGVELATKGTMNVGLAFVLMILLGCIGSAIIQTNLNKYAT